jgi:hypothetical protein
VLGAGHVACLGGVAGGAVPFCVDGTAVVPLVVVLLVLCVGTIDNTNTWVPHPTKNSLSPTHNRLHLTPPLPLPLPLRKEEEEGEEETEGRAMFPILE